MIGRVLDRISDRVLAVTLLLVTGLFLGLVLFIAATPGGPGLPFWPATSPVTGASPSASPGASATPRPSVSLLPGLVAMPADADCAGCHASDGGLIITEDPPVMGHQLEGWRDCTACHGQATLVSTAPGHTGIHANECLTCHKAEAPDASEAPHRPHSLLTNGNCLDCHGAGVAELPESMRSRDPQTCWLCHTTPEEQPPTFVHELSAVHGSCLDCHTAGAVGRLPADHDGRATSQCTLCHQAAPEGAPAAGHSLTGRQEYCTECHAAGSPPATPRP